MSLWSGLVIVMAAKLLFDLAKGLGTFRFCGPLPIKSETLAADTATSLDVLVAAFAKYLHILTPLSLSRWDCPVHSRNSSSIRLWRDIP